MKKRYLFAILFFGSLWGSVEAVLGGFLYNNDISNASVPLTVIGFMILAIARVYIPFRFSASCIGSIAMLYKFMNTPFFACHILGIFLSGLAFDALWNFSRVESKAFKGFFATYLSYAMFAFFITYVFRYHHWIEAGVPKIVRYVGFTGTITALLNFFAVPAVFNWARALKEKALDPFAFQSRLAAGVISLVTCFLWVINIITWS